MEKNVKLIAEKWYKRLNFPKEADNDFYNLLETETGFSEMLFSEFDLKVNNEFFRKNVIWALYFCEELYHKFTAKGIPEKIILDSFAGIKLNALKGFDVTGELAIRSFAYWLYLYYEFKLITLGRLQFELRGAMSGAEHLGLPAGEPVLAVHIPVGEKLTEEACLDSFKSANEFFGKYFPEYEYRFFTCYSWLLDRNLNKILPESSNIIKFGRLFEHALDLPQNDAIAFAFPFGTTRENIKDAEAKTSLQKSLKAYVLDGGTINITFGIRDKNK